MISIVVPVLDGEATIGDMLTALMSQSGAPRDREVIVVDNGSSDRTREIVRPFPFTLLEEPKRGPAAARNRGLRHARGEIVVHLDADTLPTRRWLAELLVPFDDPEVLVVGGRTLAFRPETAAERYIARSRVHETESLITNRFFPFIPSLNMAVRRSAAVEIGGWAEELRTGEDVDFCHRLRRHFAGARLVYQPSALLFHRNRSTDALLHRQAWTYGEGASELYFRYPEHARLGVKHRLLIGALLTWSTLAPELLRVGGWLGMVAADRIEFAAYRRFWGWSFWRGFFRYRRTRTYREDWKATR